MYWLDLALIVVLLSATVTGYRKGFMDQLLSLAVLIVALTCARFFAPQLVSLTQHMSEVYSGQLAWGAAFILLLILGNVVKKMIHPRRKSSGLDGLLGGTFSLVVNAFVLSIIFNYWIAWNAKGILPKLPSESKVITYILPLSKTLMASDLLDIQRELFDKNEHNAPNQVNV